MKKSLAKQRERGYNVKCLDTHFRALFHVRFLNSGILSWNKKKKKRIQFKEVALNICLFHLSGSSIIRKFNRILIKYQESVTRKMGESSY